MNIDDLIKREQALLGALRAVEEELKESGTQVQFSTVDDNGIITLSHFIFDAKNKTRAELAAYDNHARIAATRLVVRKDIEWEKKKAGLSLTCTHCGKLALPIRETNDRYRCDNCGRQFAGAKHGF